MRARDCPQSFALISGLYREHAALKDFSNALKRYSNPQEFVAVVVFHVQQISLVVMDSPQFLDWQARRRAKIRPSASGNGTPPWTTSTNM
jgi:hypothetical protein